jgi:hypothetical protein
MFMLAEAFEAPNGTTYVTRSADGGRTWQLEGPVYDKRVVGHETTDVMKPTLLRDGRLIAIGYRYDRTIRSRESGWKKRAAPASRR